MTSRREFLSGAAVGLAAGALPLPARSADAASAALDESDLVYLTPLRADGSESRCHAEVWFVRHAGALWVVTAADAWRARAVRAGLDRARLWVGEFGVWTRADEAYRAAPQLEARASLVADPQVQASVLDSFGSKYRLEWIVWGPRFRAGLADGSRVLLRYQPLS